MTLTHILPSLRGSVPDPIGRDLWPEFTITTLSDVTVAGVSLSRLAEWCGTPCVHTAAAVVPGTGGMPSSDELASVVVSCVLEVATAADGSLDVWIDARLPGSALVGELRMIGRTSTACHRRARIHDAGTSTPSPALEEVVSDVRVGDLVVVPCRGAARLREVDPARRHLVATVEGSPAWSSAMCGR